MHRVLIHPLKEPRNIFGEARYVKEGNGGKMRAQRRSKARKRIRSLEPQIRNSKSEIRNKSE